MRSIERKFESIAGVDPFECRCRSAEVMMGNAALKYESAFENDTSQLLVAWAPQPRVAPKYHASFYDAAPYDEAVGAMAYRVRRELPQIRERRTVSRDSIDDRRFERDSDVSRPQSGNFEHRNRVGVSRAPHRVDSGDVSVRSIFAGVALTALTVLGLAGLASMPVGSVPDPASVTGVVRVAEGETLNDIAAVIAPGRSVGVVIEQIMDLNAMTNSKLNVGQTLIVPAVQGY